MSIACASRLNDRLPAASMIPIAGPAAPSAVPRHKPAVPVMTAVVVRSLIRRVSTCRALIASRRRNTVVAVLNAVCAVIWAHPDRVSRCGRCPATIRLVSGLPAATTKPTLRARDSDTTEHQNSRHETHLCRIHRPSSFPPASCGPL